MTLGLTLLVGPVDEYPFGLRLARDGEGRDLLLTDAEGRRAEAQAKEVEAAGRARAEERIEELEKELAARGRRSGDP